MEIFRCKVVDVSPNEMTIEATGDHGKLEAILSLLQRFGIKELARTGSLWPCAVPRSRRSECALIFPLRTGAGAFIFLSNRE